MPPESRRLTAIGGFFGLEPHAPKGGGDASAPMAFSTGRAALRAILEHARPKRVHVPWWICDSALEPLHRLGIPLSWYAIDTDLIPQVAAPGAGEMVLVVDRFGLQDGLIQALSGMWGPRLIIDATQAWYAFPPSASWWFNSTRKFFGVPDGAVVSGPEMLSLPTGRRVPRVEYLERRARGEVEQAYPLFQAAEAALDDDLLAPAQMSDRIMAGVDLAACATRRRANFLALSRRLGPINRLRFVLPRQAVPLCYPFLPSISLDRQELHALRVYIPTFWPEVADRETPPWEQLLARDLLPLPVDQRQDFAEMERLADAIEALTLS